jgi:hypothetical protein
MLTRMFVSTLALSSTLVARGRSSGPSTKCSSLGACQRVAEKLLGHQVVVPAGDQLTEGGVSGTMLGLEFKDSTSPVVFSVFIRQPKPPESELSGSRCPSPGRLLRASSGRQFCYSTANNAVAADFLAGPLHYRVFGLPPPPADSYVQWTAGVVGAFGPP